MPFGNVYTNGLGSVGHCADVVIDAHAESSSGVMKIARLLPTATAAFSNVKNSNPKGDDRILCEAGL